MPRVLEELAAKNAAREQALPDCRLAIRFSANAIRAAHRGDLAAARSLLDKARRALDTVTAALREHADVFHAGFVHDARKEYVEAECVWHLASGRPLPGPAELRAENAAYLNGLGEAVGELRRMLLDRLRLGLFDGCEEMLGAMDDIYSALVTVDYPDTLTGGLRRTTDSVRGILERTRGDLTMAALQLGGSPARHDKSQD